MTTTTTTAAQHPQQGHILHLRQRQPTSDHCACCTSAGGDPRSCGSSSPGTSAATGRG